MTNYIGIVALLCVVCSLSGCVAEEGFCTKPINGSMSSCFDPKLKKGKINLDMRWSPGNITENQNYTVTLLKLDVPNGLTWSGGVVHVTVQIPGLDKPLYDKPLQYNCTELRKELPEHFQHLVDCPLKIPSISSPITFPNFLFPTPIVTPAEIPVPMGSYHLTVSVYEGQDEKVGAQPFICLDGWLIFAKVDPNPTADCNARSSTDNDEATPPKPDNDLKFQPVMDGDSSEIL